MSELKPVQSSNIHAVGYDAAHRRLTVQFKAKIPGEAMRTYHHEGVSQADYDALMGEGVEGHSIGKHYHAHIRARFAHQLADAEPPTPVAPADEPLFTDCRKCGGFHPAGTRCPIYG